MMFLAMGLSGAAWAEPALRMIDVCKDVDGSTARCLCAQDVADKLLSPEMQEISAISMSTGEPPEDKMAALGVTLTEMMQQWQSWSDAVEAECSPVSDGTE